MRWITPVMAALVLGGGGRVEGAPAQDLVSRAALAPAELDKYWQCPIPLRGGEGLSALYLEDENLYAVTDLGTVYAIDADVGLVRWSAFVADPPFEVFRPCHAMSKGAAHTMETCIASPKGLLVLHRRTGRLLIRMKLPFTASGPPISDGKSVYIGSVNNRYYALRPVREGVVLLEPKKKGLKWYGVIVLVDGKRLYHEAESLAKVREWQQGWLERLGGSHAEHRAAMMRWQIDTEGNVRGRPVVVDRIAYIPSDGGKLFAVSLYNKRKVWDVKTSGGIFADPLVGGGMVYAASTDRSLYAVDRIHGTRQWQCHVPSIIKRSGYITEKLIYLPGEPTGVHAVEPAAGKLLWSFEHALDFLAELKESVCLFEPGEAIQQVDIETGELIRAIPCPTASLSVGNTRDATMYIASRDGRLMCIRPEGVPYLRRAKFEAAAATTAPSTTAPASGQDAKTQTGIGKIGDQTDDPLRSRSKLRPAVNPKPPGGR